MPKVNERIDALTTLGELDEFLREYKVGHLAVFINRHGYAVNADCGLGNGGGNNLEFALKQALKEWCSAMKID